MPTTAKRDRKGPDVAGETRGRFVAPLLIALVSFAVMANSLSGGFVYDDLDNVLRNPWIREPGRLHEAFTRHMAAFAPTYDTSYYRPLMHVLLAVGHRLAGLDPWGFHLLLVLLHVACCLAVLALLERMVRLDAPGPPGIAATRAAFVGALLFAVHPVHVEAVAWISGVVDLSYSLLSVVALLALTSRSPGLRLVVGPLAFFLALLGKEPAVMVLPAYATFAVASGDLANPARRRRFLGALAALSAALGAYLLLRVGALGGLMGHGGARRIRVGLVDGAWTALALLGEYARLLVLPVRQAIVHDTPLATSPWDPRPWLGLAVLCGLGFLAWRFRRRPPVLLGLALLLFPLLPALYVPVLGEGLLGERYLYLPSVGLALLVALGWAAGERREPGPVARRVAVAAALALVGAGALLTVRQNRTWHDDLALWTNAVRNSPGSAAAHEGLGFALLGAGRPEEAARSLGRAVELEPGRRDARTNLASALLALGRPEEAIAQARTVLAEVPGKAEAHAIVAGALAELGRLDEAVAAYALAVKYDPRVATFHNGLAIALARTGDRERAAFHFREAIRLDPGRPSYRANLKALEAMPPQK